jgi:hypothetical protein
MGGNRVSGFRRAAVFGRAIARDPRPKGEGAAQRREKKITGQCDTDPRRTTLHPATVKECPEADVLKKDQCAPSPTTTKGAQLAGCA